MSPTIAWARRSHAKASMDQEASTNERDGGERAARAAGGRGGIGAGPAVGDAR